MSFAEIVLLCLLAIGYKTYGNYNMYPIYHKSLNLSMKNIRENELILWRDKMLQEATFFAECNFSLSHPG